MGTVFEEMKLLNNNIPHLRIRLFNCKPRITSEYIENFLNDFPSNMNFRKEQDARIEVIEGMICGLVEIAESHISAFVVGKNVFIDIFSKTGFGVSEINKAVGVIKKWFNPEMLKKGIVLNANE